MQPMEHNDPISRQARQWIARAEHMTPQALEEHFVAIWEYYRPLRALRDQDSAFAAAFEKAALVYRQDSLQNFDESGEPLIDELSKAIRRIDPKHTKILDARSRAVYGEILCRVAEYAQMAGAGKSLHDLYREYNQMTLDGDSALSMMDEARARIRAMASRRGPKPQ